MIWIIWNLNTYSELPKILCNYINTLYPSNGNYDYRFLLDIAAGVMKSKTIEESITTHNLLYVQNVLHQVDVAAWFALNIALKFTDDGPVHENLFFRFLYALGEIDKAHQKGYTGSTFGLLQKIEQSPLPEGLFLNLSDGLQSTLNFLRYQRNNLNRIWNIDIREHFYFIYEQLEKALLLRLQPGYRSHLAVPYAYNLFFFIDDDKHQFLLQKYESKKWVREWFKFRNQSIFTPDTSRRKMKHLTAQFGLYEFFMFCDCRRPIVKLIPKWAENIRIQCENCKTIHDFNREDMKFINNSNEVEEL